MDLSAASGLVDPSVLKEVMQRSFGVCGKALDRLADFLTDRTQVVRACSREPMVSGVQQGSVLGPKQFIKYADNT